MRMYDPLKANILLTSMNTGMSCLKEPMVLIDCTMQLASHRDIKLYKRYSKQCFEIISASAMQSVISF